MNQPQDPAAAIGGEIQARAAAALGSETLAKIEAQTLADFRGIQVQELEQRVAEAEASAKAAAELNAVAKAEVVRLNKVVAELRELLDAC